MKSIIKPYIQPAFLICAGILAVAGAGKSIAVKQLGVHLKKLPIALKKPLALMNEESLSPYELWRKGKIANKDVLEQLGTEEYLQWTLEDSQADKSDPVRYCSVFITYYTGNPDQVPHVPEECYVGGGNQRLRLESLRLNVKGVESTATEVDIRISARYVVFVRSNSDMWEADSKYPVLYFFRANGKYAGSRTETRKIMGENIFGKYSYFSKVEWMFFGNRYGRRIYPDKKEAITASEKLLSVLLPIMERDHWPDWDKADSEK